MEPTGGSIASQSQDSGGIPLTLPSARDKKKGSQRIANIRKSIASEALAKSFSNRILVKLDTDHPCLPPSEGLAERSGGFLSP